ncbi:MAG: threonine synthase [Armatimonadota bacterium]|nr:threonine synthase [Armatimonadota bacterium]MDR5696414.1 threonine synthase [Armatimonadota bacterium]
MSSQRHPAGRASSAWDASTPWPGVLAAFADRLPVTERTPALTLLEGNTPLVRSVSMGRDLPGAELWFKCEGLNPTGSFKDRGMVVAVAKGAEAGSRGVICASTGNTAASAAAYAARAGLQCIVVLPEGTVAAGKLAQARMHGATVATIPGGFDQALELVREAAPRGNLTLVNSVNPYRIEGQKTAAFEIHRALGRAPDVVALPVGNAGNITAYWRGFCEILPPGDRPRMWGFQAEGAAPIVRGHPVDAPQTVATAIRIGRPASWQGALTAAAESGGLIAEVSDGEILDAQSRLAREEGLFVEPASAASVAGLLRTMREGVRVEGTVVAVLTGHGLKDPASAERGAQPIRVAPTVEAILGLLALAKTASSVGCHKAAGGSPTHDRRMRYTSDSRCCRSVCWV